LHNYEPERTTQLPDGVCERVNEARLGQTEVVHVGELPVDRTPTEEQEHKQTEFDADDAAFCVLQAGYQHQHPRNRPHRPGVDEFTHGQQPHVPVDEHVRYLAHEVQPEETYDLAQRKRVVEQQRLAQHLMLLEWQLVSQTHPEEVVSDETHDDAHRARLTEHDLDVLKRTQFLPGLVRLDLVRLTALVGVSVVDYEYFLLVRNVGILFRLDGAEESNEHSQHEPSKPKHVEHLLLTPVLDDDGSDYVGKRSAQENARLLDRVEA